MKMTVGNLRSVLTGLPDDMPVEVYSENMDCLVEWDYTIQSPIDGWEELIDKQSFVIRTEN